MKKASALIALIISVILLVGLICFYLYRNSTGTPLLIQRLPSAASTLTDSHETMPTTDGLLNINTADLAQLSALPGIGQVLAQRIIDYRHTNGDFRSPADLLNIPGIGEKKLEAILDLITTGGNT